MHPNKAFRKATREQNLAFARHRGFGVLTINGADGPLASHIPFVLNDDNKTFRAHLVRSNPIVRQLEAPLNAAMIISGPDAYISPDWYGITDQVPTWNYVAVHLRGQLKKLPPQTLRPHLEALSASFERQLLPKPEWLIDKVTPDTLAKLERMIVPVEFTIHQVDGTWKLAQNKPTEARIGAAEGLAASQIGQMIDEMAVLMRQIDA